LILSVFPILRNIFLKLSDLLTTFLELVPLGVCDPNKFLELPVLGVLELPVLGAVLVPLGVCDPNKFLELVPLGVCDPNKFLELPVLGVVGVTLRSCLLLGEENSPTDVGLTSSSTMPVSFSVASVVGDTLRCCLL
jgi:hypothetical protein